MIRISAAAVIVAASLAIAGCASTQTTAGGSKPGSSGNAAPSVGGTAPSPGGATSGPSIGGTAGVSPPPSAIAGAPATIAASCPAVQNFAVPNGPAARAVPAGIQVAWVLRCTIVSKGGIPSELVAERSISDPKPLVNALKTPSAQRPKVVCPMYVVQLPYFALVQTDGKVFVPTVPINNCGKPQNLVLAALNSLKFAELSSKPLK